MRRLPPKVYAAKAAYLDPADCDSIIAYSITSRGSLSSCVNLSDCNRKISWYFDNEESGLKKIDRIISLLTEFRQDFIQARKQWKKPKPRKR